MIFARGIRLFAIGAAGRCCLIFSIEKLGSARRTANQFRLGTFSRDRFTVVTGFDGFMNRVFVRRIILSTASTDQGGTYPGAQDDNEQGNHDEPRLGQSRVQGGHLSEYFSSLCLILSQESCQPLLIH